MIARANNSSSNVKPRAAQRCSAAALREESREDGGNNGLTESDNCHTLSLRRACRFTHQSD